MSEFICSQLGKLHVEGTTEAYPVFELSEVCVCDVFDDKDQNEFM